MVSLTFFSSSLIVQYHNSLSSLIIMQTYMRKSLQNIKKISKKVKLIPGKEMFWTKFFCWKHCKVTYSWLESKFCVEPSKNSLYPSAFHSPILSFFSLFLANLNFFFCFFPLFSFPVLNFQHYYLLPLLIRKDSGVTPIVEKKKVWGSLSWRLGSSYIKTTTTFWTWVIEKWKYSWKREGWARKSEREREKERKKESVTK